ncbi:MAG: hypothetical protein LAP87_06305 [Acidobacteriia bacterium]|nr:hypothetical protein [Terriglobia bacterium]
MNPALVFFVALAVPAALPGQVTAIRAGRLIDPATGEVSTNQLILVEAGRFRAIGAGLPVPAGAEVVDLSQLTVLPGLVDAHNHLALTYKRDPENNSYYLTSVLDSTAIRAIQAVSNGITMMSAGFTIARPGQRRQLRRQRAAHRHRAGLDSRADGHQLGNHHRRHGRAVYAGFPTGRLVYPEYLDAGTPDEIVKAVRKNVRYGARVIKIMVDAKP